MAESPVGAGGGVDDLDGWPSPPVPDDQASARAGAKAGARGPRRRQANVAGGRGHSFKVKTSAEQAQVLISRAVVAGVSVPRLLVEAALAGPGGRTSTQRHEVMAELFAVHRKLSGIAVNINQVAKATNATREAPESAGWVAALEAVREVAARVDEAVATVAGDKPGGVGR